MSATRASIDRRIDALAAYTARLTHDVERRALAAAGAVAAAGMVIVWWRRHRRHRGPDFRRHARRRVRAM